VLSLIKVKRVLRVEVKVEAFFSNFILTRLKDLLIYSDTFISASLTFFLISGFIL